MIVLECEVVNFVDHRVIHCCGPAALLHPLRAHETYHPSLRALAPTTLGVVLLVSKLRLGPKPLGRNHLAGREFGRLLCCCCGCLWKVLVAVVLHGLLAV